MMLEFNNPIPVVTEDGQDGFAIYVTNGGSFENDVWAVALCKGGYVRHYLSSQIRIFNNATLGIKKEKI